MDRESRSWTQVRKQSLPQGDVLYTIQETPETKQARYVQTQTKSYILEDKSSQWSIETHFDSCTTMSARSLPSFGDSSSSEETDTDGSKQVDDLQPQFALALKASEEALAHWKSKAEEMEKQKQTMRSWMSETAIKIRDNIRRMKEMTEKIREVREAELDPTSAISKCSSTEDLSILSTQMVDCDSVLGSSQPMTACSTLEETAEPCSPCSLHGDNGTQTDNNPKDVSSDFNKAESYSVGKLSDAYCYFEFAQLLTSPQDAIAKLDDNIKKHALDTIKMLTPKEWNRVKLLYRILKRAGKVDQFLVYEFAKDIVKACKGAENVDEFLTNFDSDPAEGAFKFGRTLLTIFHASLLLNGATDEEFDDVDVYKNRRVLPRRTAHNTHMSWGMQRRSVYDPYSPHKRKFEEISKFMASFPTPYVNPAYSHVKSRYLDALKPNSKKGRQTSAKKKPPNCNINVKNNRAKSANEQTFRQGTQSKGKTEQLKTSHFVSKRTVTVVSKILNQDAHRFSATVTDSKNESRSATATTDSETKSTRNLAASKGCIIVPTNSVISLVRPKTASVSNTIATSDSESDGADAKKGRSANQGMGDYSKPLFKLCRAKSETELKSHKTDQFTSMDDSKSSKPSWKLMKVHAGDNHSDSTENSCDDLWDSSHDVLPVKEAPQPLNSENCVSRRGSFLAFPKTGATPEKMKFHSGGGTVEIEGYTNESPFFELQRKLSTIGTTMLTTLFTHVIASYVMVLSGQALGVPEDYENITGHLSQTLKTKLRTMLIRALRMVDDY